MYEPTDRKEVVKGSSDRVFGLVFTAFFSIIGVWPLLRGFGDITTRLWSFIIAAAFLTTSLVYPKALHSLNKAWTRFGLLLQKITHPIIMGIVFFFLITPISMFFRLKGRDALKRRFDKDAKSYWIKRDDKTEHSENMKNQF